jgi:hypothetical protein
VAPADAHMACCLFRQYAIDAISGADFQTRCNLLEAFDRIRCPPLPSSNEFGNIAGGAGSYVAEVQKAIQVVLITLVKLLTECVCHHLLPPCAPDPGDNRLILACVTVKDGRIIDICNFTCRKFAGSFPSLFYWMSLVPVIPILRAAAETLCCTDWLYERNQSANRDSELTSTPVTTVLKLLVESNFALPKMYLNQSSDLIQKFSMSNLVASFPASSLNLAILNGMSTAEAKKTLDAMKISSEDRTIASRADLPVGFGSALAGAGSHVVLYQTGGLVVEARLVPATATQPDAELKALRLELEALRGEVGQLKTSTHQPPAKK